MAQISRVVRIAAWGLVVLGAACSDAPSVQEPRTVLADGERAQPGGSQESNDPPAVAVPGGSLLPPMTPAVDELPWQPGPMIDDGFSEPIGDVVTDFRTPIVAARRPPAISGGTLLVTKQGFTAVAADPDRDRVSFVDLEQGELLGHVALEPGDEPGRLVEDGAGRVHVALRGGGALLTLDIATRSVLARREACSAPRGVAYEAAQDAVHVACAGGELLTFPAGSGPAQRTLRFGPDLRDVVVRGDQLFVTEFKSAAVLQLDADGTLLRRVEPEPLTRDLMLGADRSLGVASSHRFEPALARRAVALGTDQVAVLHQREMADAIELGDPHDPSSTPIEAASAYGAGGSCDSIVQTGVSIVRPDGSVLQSSSLAGSVLPVDLAISPDRLMLAVANAGQRDIGAPSRNPFTGFAPVGAEALGVVSLVSLTAAPLSEDDSALSGECGFDSVVVPGQPTAVAFAADGALIVQSREPATLMVVTHGEGGKTIALGGESVLDTGHDIFHRDAGAGIACGSCHGEGGEDGHVWEFAGMGPRRTQAVNVGLAGTAPFHWTGDMSDLGMLMSEVFVGRMGGVGQSVERVDALASWMFEAEPLPALRAADDPAALRGRALFESEGTACASCHSGAQLTNNLSVDVGTGGLFQVPSLRGIAYRAPFMHTGCAETLRERFDPECGGALHGLTGQLSEQEIGDLIAYLETL